MFPVLYAKNSLPPRAEAGANKVMAHSEANPVAEKATKVHIAPAVTHSLIDAARTSVAVMGDTFEAFSLV